MVESKLVRFICHGNLIAAETSVDTNSDPNDLQGSAKVNKTTMSSTPSTERWTSSFTLEQLTDQQSTEAKEMLYEKSAVFAKDDHDNGCILQLQMKMRLWDDIPVQKSYQSIPRQLYQEVKHYLEDLLERGWIHKSESPYASPVVCVRKKDGTFRLCVDYRELNWKTIPDCHPIPKIQDVLDNLGGNCRFTTLDQGKAYHQGFIAEECRPMTAFVTPWTSTSGSGSPLDLKMPLQPTSGAWRMPLRG